MTYAIILPVTKPDLAETCLNSIDPLIRVNVIEVDNTLHNIGVARSWNVGAKHVLDNKLDFLIICSQSMVFTDGMRDFIDQLNPNESGKNTKFGWHLIALSRDTIEKCGLFDTNFYPAYYEDSDYIRRLELLGIHEPLGDTHIPFAEVNAREQGRALAISGRNPIAINYGAVKGYFIRKWGDEPFYDQGRRDSLYSHPFNNPSLSLDYFEDRTIEELKKEYNL